ncbi:MULTISPECIES: cyclodeaminase/cyclohydrolase family protein [Loigolactobacillus]|uniref:Sugar ABC transporter substrate-binding protein n=1 Tax=Loigolactobacillus backii TaxID=375175 RepID=A0A192GZN7_9LACO|nr:MULTISPECIES: cyclodeaminase/cyclohydrolase family protein [Loigolactobacillus]ANK60869.1 sugar ABC transporter substrate-binding protein [Loigolactobacillus backii]ANK61555.1 sugar ABC transporter substrate-binding protein [Loigolactobacillus backii]ANK65822.1 sugar ABC transporter substrate-binding protein [Loigolactobacillus backii]ANK68298.1 sugar ABC transporter substrate-binding protein [Loigolactobacillus backii]ANK69247.1 sugar ABC transporter substrate-binding protein [Loigolactoba
MEIKTFIQELASDAPTPGGGGVSALTGAMAAALASMTASLTLGKKKYAAYTTDLQQIITTMQQLSGELLAQISADAVGFEPLAKAYGIPKTASHRDEILEVALVKATEVPFTVLRLLNDVVPVLEQLLIQGSRLMQSDVGVAAATCRGALEGSVLNVYVNTRLMKNRDQAKEMNQRADKLVTGLSLRCQQVYQQVSEQLQSN